jgi:hypothetical protein
MVSFRETYCLPFLGLKPVWGKSLLTEKKGGKEKWLLTEMLGENRL